MQSKLFFAKAQLLGMAMAIGLMIVGSSAYAGFKICKNQTYALCAEARCLVYNGVAYCQCNVKSGNSISLSFKLKKGQDVCSVNAAGAKNGYMVSTYSLPHSVLPPQGNQAVYTCPGDKSDGAYAQCDGGLCFTSTEGTSFPGFDKLTKGQIICACPITVTKPGKLRPGYQFIGPYPCQKSFFQYCKSSTANNKTGSSIYVGAPTGIPRLLTVWIHGSFPPINECKF